MQPSENKIYRYFNNKHFNDWTQRKQLILFSENPTLRFEGNKIDCFPRDQSSSEILKLEISRYITIKNNKMQPSENKTNRPFVTEIFGKGCQWHLAKMSFLLLSPFLKDHSIIPKSLCLIVSSIQGPRKSVLQLVLQASCSQHLLAQKSFHQPPKVF